MTQSAPLSGFSKHSNIRAVVLMICRKGCGAHTAFLWEVLCLDLRGTNIIQNMHVSLFSTCVISSRA